MVDFFLIFLATIIKRLVFLCVSFCCCDGRSVDWKGLGLFHQSVWLLFAGTVVLVAVALRFDLISSIMMLSLFVWFRITVAIWDLLCFHRNSSFFPFIHSFFFFENVIIPPMEFVLNMNNFGWVRHFTNIQWFLYRILKEY